MKSTRHVQQTLMGESVPWRPSWGRHGLIIFLITAGVFTVLLWRIDAREMARSIRSARISHLLLMMAVSLLINVWMAADKYLRILKLVDCEISLRESIFIRVASAPLKLVIPGKAGELAKAVYLKKTRSLALGSGLSTILFDKATNLVAAFVLLITVTYWYAAPAAPIRLYLFGLIIIVLFLSLHRLTFLEIVAARLPTRPRQTIQRVTSAFASTNARGKLFFILYSILFECSEILNTYLALRALGVDIPFLDAFALVPIVILIGNLPLTIAGLGTREAAFILVYGRWASASVLFSAGLLVSLIEYVFLAFVGALFLPRFLRSLRSNGTPAPGDADHQD